MGKRIVALFGVLVFLYSAILWRVAWIGQDGELAQAANRQSTYTLEVYESRGMIYDCEGLPLVNQEKRSLAAVLPGNQSAAALRDQFSSAELWQERMQQNTPFVMEVDPQSFKSDGIQLFQSPVRYTDDHTAAHIVGYVDGDGVGQTGMERVFDDFLRQRGEQVSVRYQVDAVGQALAGGGMEILREGNGSDGLCLTLHKKLQQACEQILEEAQVCGAIIVMEIPSGDLKTVASAPDFDPREVASAFKDERSPLINRAFGAYAVGSTFKLLVAAAALEEGIPPEQAFVCEGWCDVEGQIFKCNNLAGHGELAMEEAVALSCNCYFIRLAQMTGAKKLREMALRFGFSQQDVLADGLSSAAGTLPDETQLQNPAELANLGFGQGYLTATPLQICKMVAAMASGGALPVPRLIEGLMENGVYTREERFAPNQVLGGETADILCRMMRSVVEEGSGQMAQPLIGGAGGKTASAQTGSFDEQGKEEVHAWFAGFYPAEEPRYAITVFVENGQSGTQEAAPLFAKAANSLYRLGLVENEVE